MLRLKKKNEGMSLIEIMVVMAIITIMATLMGRAISKNNLDFQKLYTTILADIRFVQAMATSGAQYQGVFRCGFGIHYENNTTYSLYAGPDASSVDCLTDNTNFGQGAVGDIRLSGYSMKVINDPDLEFKNSFPDVFFKPPDPKVFINNQNIYRVVGNLNHSALTIGKKGQNCPQKCKTICVYSSGNVELRDGGSNSC